MQAEDLLRNIYSVYFSGHLNLIKAAPRGLMLPPPPTQPPKVLMTEWDLKHECTHCSK